MTDLVVVRHAIAAEGDDDAARPLTERGRRRFSAMVETLVSRGPSVDVILHSPLLRAVQTAELLTLACSRTEVSPLLAQEPSPDLLERLAQEERAAVVGHSPWLERLIAWLVCGDREAGRAWDLRKGGVAWLTGEPRPGEMRLRAFLPPRLAG